MNQCSKCTQPTRASSFCNDCLHLMGKPCAPVSEARRRELGTFVTAMDKQILEPIPFVMAVEQWPELFAPAKPQQACYNGEVPLHLP